MRLGNKEIFEAELQKLGITIFELLANFTLSANIETIKILLKNGADYKTALGYRANRNKELYKKPYVFLAIASQSEECLDLVIQEGASLTERGMVQGTQDDYLLVSNAIGFAAYVGCAPALKVLLEKIPQCIEERSSECPGLTIKKGAKKSALFGYTPLMLAVQNDDNIECVKLLVEAGADSNVKDRFGHTLLHIAAMSKSNNILRYLCKNFKIDPFERSKKGFTAFDNCGIYDNQEGQVILTELQDEHDSKITNSIDDLLAEESRELKMIKKKSKRQRKKAKNNIEKADSMV